MADLLDILFTPEFQARFSAKFERGRPDDCWNWKGSVSGQTGYGGASVNRRNVGAHRVAWMLENKRTVPPGLVVRHRCDNRLCVNPRHLQLGTKADNTQDAVERGRIAGVGQENAEKERCQKGHLLDGFQPLRGRNGYRFCRKCTNEASKLRKRAKREALGFEVKPRRRS